MPSAWQLLMNSIFGASLASQSILCNHLKAFITFMKGTLYAANMQTLVNQNNLMRSHSIIQDISSK